jgi:Trk K+ transport system NAD-binding subunit
MLRKYTDRDVNDYAAVLHLTDNFKIIEATVDSDGWVCHRTLQELNLREEGITILGVDRKGSGYYGSPSGVFKLLPGDIITIYGKSECISSLYNRKKDFYADLEHEKFVEKEETRQQEEQDKVELEQEK